MPSESDDPITQAEHEQYHTSAYSAAGSAMMSFAPINQIHQHLCGLHIYSHDPSRAVKAHHFCTHLRSNLHQCVIYDSDKADARLIGIEYLIPEKEFEELPKEEKQYWHSHKYEVDSGMLMLVTKSLIPSSCTIGNAWLDIHKLMVPAVVTDVAERPAMLELHRTYGKTIHTWQYDLYPDLPLGPPQLMLAYTANDQVDRNILSERDAELGVSTETKRKVRHGYLRQEDLEREPAEGCDVWVEGKRLQLKLVGGD